MNVGKKYVNNAIIYTIFKKHYCPACGTKLGRVKTSKTVNSNSPEAKNYDFTLGDSFMAGDVEFVWKEFYCPTCKNRISIDEMRRIEKAQRGKMNEK